MMRKVAPLVLAGLLALPLVSGAQIINGDFEDGESGWALMEPADWTVEVETTGGNPDRYALIRSPFLASADTEACLGQMFNCGAMGDSMCMIVFDFQCFAIDIFFHP